jgi:hypothetical protein
MRNALVILLLALVHAPVSAEPLQEETLQQAIPDGFVIGSSTDDGRDALTEFVPRGETVGDWSRMLTVQILRGRGHVTPAQFRETIAGLWLQACPEGTVADMTGGTENGYPVGLWFQGCPRNAATGQPEFTLLKAIQGNDSLYVIQAAMRSMPTEADITEQVGWLRGAQACDSRRPEQACPTNALMPATPVQQQALDGRGKR